MELRGKPVADAIAMRLEKQIKQLDQQGITPCLAIVRFTDDGAAEIYGNTLAKKAETMGLRVVHAVACEKTMDEACAYLAQLGNEESIDGILVLMPLPRGWDKSQIIAAIPVDKDIDGMTPGQAGRLFTGDETFAPATAKACMAILKHYQIPLAGKRAVVLGRSQVIGKPVAQLLLNENATVTICHSQTCDLASEIARAEILIAAVGQAEMVKAAMVSPQIVVVDVGIHRRDDGIVGDVARDVADVAKAYTPVPGGVGAVTTLAMLENVVEAAGQRKKQS